MENCVHYFFSHPPSKHHSSSLIFSSFLQGNVDTFTVLKPIWVLAFVVALVIALGFVYVIDKVVISHFVVLDVSTSEIELGVVNVGDDDDDDDEDDDDNASVEIVVHSDNEHQELDLVPGINPIAIEHFLFMYQEEDCSVCLGEFETMFHWRIQYVDTFHFHCLSQWNVNTCPKCRTIFSIVLIGDVIIVFNMRCTSE